MLLSTSVKRIPSLDGLRAISISLVIFGHLLSARHGSTAISVYSNTGVRIFFVISGFLITTILLNEHSQTGTISLREFYLRRAYRIFPAACVFVLAILIFFWRSLRWYDVAAMLFYMVNFDGARPWMIGHLWSLSVEEQFYFLWPSVLRKWYQHRVPILLGVCALAPLYSSVCYFYKLPSGGYGTFPSVADNLAVGCLAAMLSQRIPKINGPAAFIMTSIVIAVPLFAANTPLRTLLMLFILWPVMHLSIAGLVLHVVRTPYRFLNSLPIVWLGKISYSLYLWQQVFCFNPSLNQGYRFVPVALLVACLSYYLVEQPALRLRDARTVPSRPLDRAPLRESS